MDNPYITGNTPEYQQQTLEEHKRRWLEHSAEKAMERYGILFNKNVQDGITKDYYNLVFNQLVEIESNPSRLVLRGRVQGVVTTFVYDKRHEAVITFLQNNWVAHDALDPEEVYVRKKQSSKKNKKRKERDPLFTGGKKRNVWHGKRPTKSRIRGANYKRAEERTYVEEELSDGTKRL